MRRSFGEVEIAWAHALAHYGGKHVSRHYNGEDRLGYRVGRVQNNNENLLCDLAPARHEARAERSYDGGGWIEQVLHVDFNLRRCVVDGHRRDKLLKPNTMGRGLDSEAAALE